MKGDFSRYTFDRKKHYSAVLMQQGRVQVDADWNEQEAIDQYRIETEAIDVIGKCGAPKYNAGFGIEAANSQFNIGSGRFYVDGILCENEATILYDEQPDLPDVPDLNTLFSEADTDLGIIYLDVWKRHLTALDDPRMREVALSGPDTTTRLKTIWQVKVLPITDTEPNDLTCDSDSSEWENLIGLNPGRLNARTAESEDTDNPCLIPPDAGYLRLENQLYRVEIHHGSDSETGATFKWSRDNGSIVTEIKRMDGSEVTVADLGYDDVLGFARGQWVEIIDDALELNGLPGELIQIDNFANDADGRPIVILASTPTPLASGADFPDNVNPARHPKLRRWDQKTDAVTNATADGIAISDGWTALEGGIQVQFLDDGTYKTGDYWLIPARTATGQIEWPTTDTPNPAPIPQFPLGITHHYCRLAIAQFIPSNDPNEIEGDIRILEVCDYTFDPLPEIDSGESCCTVVVEPGEDIQAALDSLPQAGGCVCLKTGRHTIQRPIRIEKSNVVLKGESPGTQVIRSNGLSLLVIAQPQNQLISNVVVHQIRFEATGIGSERPTLLGSTLLVINNGLSIHVSHCHLEVAELPRTNSLEAALPIAPAIGMVVVNVRHVSVLANTFRLAVISIWAEGCAACEFSENLLIGSVAQANDIAVSLGYVGILLNLLTPETSPLGDDCQINENDIQDFLLGIVTGSRSHRTQIRNNYIRRQSTTQLLIDEFNNQFLAGNEPYIYGIITYGNYITIAENYIDLGSPSYGGIRVFGTHTRIESNILQSNLTRELQVRSSQLPLAIFLGQFVIDTDANIQRILSEFNASVITQNQLHGILTGIGIANAEAVVVSKNQLNFSQSFASLPSVGIALGNTRNTTVIQNQIYNADLGIFLIGEPPTEGTGNCILDNSIYNGSYGISAIAETALKVSNNRIENAKLAGFAAINLFETASLSHNHIHHCGYEPPSSNIRNSAIGAGIFIISVFGNLTVDSCQIVNTGISQEGQVAIETAQWGIAIGLVTACQITHNQVFYTDVANIRQLNPSLAHRSLILLGWFFPVNAEIQYPQLGSALVTNNVFQGIGTPHLVEFLKNLNAPQFGFEYVNFSHNQCFHLLVSGDRQPIGVAVAIQNSTVSTWGRRLVVMGNQVDADTPNFPSIDLSSPERVTLIGNTTSGTVFNPGSGLRPANPEDFNIFPF